MKNQVLQQTPLKKIHVVFKTHLDVGFTGLAANVVRAYFEQYIPKAIDLAQKMRLAGEQNRFIWTTGSWLIYEYLEQASPENRERLERAIADGDIVWHGLPFTTHSELMDAGLFRFGLSLSQELDRRYEKKTIAAKFSDVPGHSLGIVPLMAEAGIQLLHIGVNPASTSPKVPPVFVWRNPQGAELVVIYHQGSYGSLEIVPGMEDALYFAHTSDNLGPQSPEQINTVFRKLQRRFPNVEVAGSTMDAFAAKLAQVKKDLPVVTQELGDTWIHGVASDPQKVSRFRSLLRLRSAWLEKRQVDPQNSSFKAFSRFLLMVPEHTWGMDVKTHLDDYTAYDPASLAGARSQANFRNLESSWAEQRAYLQDALQALEAGLPEEAHTARRALQSGAPARPDLSQFDLIDDPAGLFETPFFRLRFDPLSGAVTHLMDRRTQRNWATPKHALGAICYESFSQADYDRFYGQYIIERREDTSWAKQDFTKPGIAAAGAQHAEWRPVLKQTYRRSSEQAEQFVFCLEAPQPAWQQFGCPRTFFVGLDCSKTEPTLEFDVQWFDKQANRLPEAIWFSFSPLACAAGGWRLLKLGQALAPDDVALDGNRHLHAVLPGVVYRDERSCLALDTLDAALVAPGRPSLLNFNNRRQTKDYGMHFLLYDNVWGTNFPMWYEEDARFRFILRLP